MKLIYCVKCHSVLNLSLKEKSCPCGESRGQYTDNLNAWYEGPCLPLGFRNSTFVDALYNQPEKEWGEPFTAFVIQKECDTFTKRDNTVVELPKRVSQSEKFKQLFESLQAKEEYTPEVEIPKKKTTRKKTVKKGW